MEMILALSIFAIIFIYFYTILITDEKPIECPKCKKQAKIIEKGYDYYGEHYCSNCGYKYGLTRW